jgi:hypothetical protein
LFAVYERDAWMGTDAFVSYGVVALPLAPGMHELECHTWWGPTRPIYSYFLQSFIKPPPGAHTVSINQSYHPLFLAARPHFKASNEYP